VTPSRALLALAIVGVLVDGWVAAYGAQWYRTVDFACLREGARLVASGLDPYDGANWTALAEPHPDPFRGLATPTCVARYASPLWTAAVMLPFGILAPEPAAALWMAASIGAAILGMRWIWAAVGGPARLAPLFAALVVASQPFWLLLVGAQVNGVLLGLVGGAAYAAARGRDATAGALLAALALKPQVAGIFAPAAVLRDTFGGRPRVLAGAAAVFAALLGASVLIRPFWIVSWLDEVTGRRLGYSGLLPSAWGLSSDLFGTVAVAPLLIVGVALALWLVARGHALDRVAFGAVVLPLSLFAMPHVWSYDFLALALPWGFALARSARMRGAPRVAMLAAAVVVASPLPWVMYAVGLARGSEQWSAVVPVATAIAAAAAHRLSNVRIISEPNT
jgi:hypothetical protein